MDTLISTAIGFAVLALIVWGSTGAMFSRRFTRDELLAAQQQPTESEDPETPST